MIGARRATGSSFGPIDIKMIRPGKISFSEMDGKKQPLITLPGREELAANHRRKGQQETNEASSRGAHWTRRIQRKIVHTVGNYPLAIAEGTVTLLKYLADARSRIDEADEPSRATQIDELAGNLAALHEDVNFGPLYREMVASRTPRL